MLRRKTHGQTHAARTEPWHTSYQQTHCQRHPHGWPKGQRLCSSAASKLACMHTAERENGFLHKSLHKTLDTITTLFTWPESTLLRHNKRGISRGRQGDSYAAQQPADLPTNTPQAERYTGRDESRQTCCSSSFSALSSAWDSCRAASRLCTFCESSLLMLFSF